jgi:hypothetical protein
MNPLDLHSIYNRIYGIVRACVAVFGMASILAAGVVFIANWRGYHVFIAGQEYNYQKIECADFFHNYFISSNFPERTQSTNPHKTPCYHSSGI